MEHETGYTDHGTTEKCQKRKARSHHNHTSTSLCTTQKPEVVGHQLVAYVTSATGSRLTHVQTDVAEVWMTGGM